MICSTFAVLIIFKISFLLATDIPSGTGIGYAPVKHRRFGRQLSSWVNRPSVTTSGSGDISSSGTGKYTTVISCLSADSTVVTQYGPISMSDLYQSGWEDIQVLTADGNFSPIAFWLHADPQRSTEFLRITTIGGRTITLTRGHLLFKTDCGRIERQSVRTEKISIGDCLLVDTEGQLQTQQIIKVDKIYSVGIYSPVTVSGDLMVDNILVSCYSEVEAVKLQSLMFSYLKSIKFISEQFLSANFFSKIFGHNVNFMPIVEQLLDLSDKFIA